MFLPFCFLTTETHRHAHKLLRCILWTTLTCCQCLSVLAGAWCGREQWIRWDSRRFHRTQPRGQIHSSLKVVLWGRWHFLYFRDEGTTVQGGITGPKLDCRWQCQALYPGSPTPVSPTATPHLPSAQEALQERTWDTVRTCYSQHLPIEVGILTICERGLYSKTKISHKRHILEIMEATDLQNQIFS